VLGNDIFSNINNTANATSDGDVMAGEFNIILELLFANWTKNYPIPYINNFIDGLFPTSDWAEWIQSGPYRPAPSAVSPSSPYNGLLYYVNRGNSRQTVQNDQHSNIINGTVGKDIIAAQFFAVCIPVLYDDTHFISAQLVEQLEFASSMWSGFPPSLAFYYGITTVNSFQTTDLILSYDAFDIINPPYYAYFNQYLITPSLENFVFNFIFNQKELSQMHKDIRQLSHMPGNANGEKFVWTEGNYVALSVNWS